MPLQNVEDDIRTELVRKLIHLTAFLIPAIYYFVDRRFALSVLIPLTAVAVFLEWARYSTEGFGRWFNKWLGPILRKKERPEGARTFHAAVWTLIVSTVMVGLFPKYVTIFSLTVWIFGDGAAALVGRRLGRHRIGDRTLQGSLGFLLAALLVVAATPRLGNGLGEYVICIAAAVVGTVVELLSRDPIEDNLSVPLSIAGTVWILYFLVYPALKLNDFGFH